MRVPASTKRRHKRCACPRLHKTATQVCVSPPPQNGDTRGEQAGGGACCLMVGVTYRCQYNPRLDHFSSRRDCCPPRPVNTAREPLSSTRTALHSKVLLASSASGLSTATLSSAQKHYSPRPKLPSTHKHRWPCQNCPPLINIDGPFLEVSSTHKH